MKNRTRLRIGTLLFSLVVQLVFLAIAIARGPTHRDESPEVLFVFVVSIVGSSLILARSGFDRFWKTYLFSCFAASVPITVYIIVAGTVWGLGGYAWLGIIVFTILWIVSSVAALPFAGLFYWAIKRKGRDQFPRRRMRTI